MRRLFAKSTTFLSSGVTATSVRRLGRLGRLRHLRRLRCLRRLRRLRRLRSLRRLRRLGRLRCLTPCWIKKRWPNEIDNALPAFPAMGPGLQPCFRKPQRLAHRRCLPHTPLGASLCCVLWRPGPARRTISQHIPTSTNLCVLFVRAVKVGVT